MSCCGETAARHLTISQKDIDAGLQLRIEYTGGRGVEVKGPITGKTYGFSGLRRVSPVDPRDAPAILRNQRFRLMGTTRVTV